MKKCQLFYFFLTAILCIGLISCSDDDDDDVIRSNEKKITEFAINSVKAEIEETNKTITLTLPAGTDVTKLKPQIKVSDKASVTPTSDTETDFTKPVTYTVTAEDGSTQAYTATVTLEVKKTPFLVSKIRVTSNNEFADIAFTYNEDNTLAKYAVINDKTTAEFMSCVFTYDSQKRLTEVKTYEEGELYYTYTYKYMEGNKVEVLEVTTDEPDPDKPNNPYIYTLNDKGFPIKMEQKGYIYFVENEEGGGHGGEAATITRTYEYNADNTFKKITDLYFYEFHEVPYSDTRIYNYEHDTDTYHPLQNLPAGNLYLYEKFLLDLSIGITGSGAFAGNCTMYNEKAHGNDKFEDYSTTYQYGEHKFPIKAQMTTTIEDDDTENYELIFEYIEK